MTAAAFAALILAGSAAQGEPAHEPRVLTIGEALRAALRQNPELLDSADALSSAQIAERGTRSTYLPQVVPFFSTERGRETGRRRETYGMTASEQFPFGTALEGEASVVRDPTIAPTLPYGSAYRLTLTQPLARGADPAVAAEPLRQARRTVSAQARSLEIVRRRTVLLVYQQYLGLARQLEAARLEAERLERAGKITEFSRARFSAGSVSRLDVLRAEQQEATAALARNDAENLVEDFRDSLRRAAGLDRDFDFTIVPPEDLPAAEPDLAHAVEDLLDRRPEAQEARDQVTDAEFAVRIARSLQLPSLLGVVTYDASNAGTTAGGALRPRNPALLFGLRSQYGLNSGVLFAQRREAEVTLQVRRRDLRVLEDDLVREVRRAYRRLDALRRDHDIVVENAKVAELQARVARLRFEKGLSDNFHVIDAENLLNAARLLELDSRFAILLARLDCLYFSGWLEPSPFLQQP